MSLVLDQIQFAEDNLDLSSMIQLTEKWINKTAPKPKPARFCSRMFDLEKIYGLHNVKVKREPV